MRRLLLIIVIVMAPCYLMAQNFEALGKPKEDVRRLSKSMLYITKTETDTCDVYSLLGEMKVLFFYKAGICSKIENVFLLSYKDSFVAALNHEGNLIGENTWTIDDGAIKVRLTTVEEKNQFILDISSVAQNAH